MPDPIKLRHFHAVRIDFERGAERSDTDPLRIVTQFYEVSDEGPDVLLFEADPILAMLATGDDEDLPEAEEQEDGDA